MNREIFEKIARERFSKIESVLLQKSKEYASDEDYLRAFKSAAMLKLETPEKALWGFMVKHLLCVIDMINGTLPVTRHLKEEKLGDLINYLFLLEGLFEERLMSQSNVQDFFDNINKKIEDALVHANNHSPNTDNVVNLHAQKQAPTNDEPEAC
jgi:hypothetical protein